MQEIEVVIRELVQNYQMCRRCMGRAFGRHKSEGFDITIKNTESLPYDILEKAVDSILCDLCKGVVDKSIEIIDKVIIALSSFEFETFLVGVKMGKNFTVADEVYLNKGIKPLLLKFEVSREFGLRIGKALKKEVDFKSPDVRITLECRNAGKIRYSIDSTAIYILGKYRKEKRGLPQTKWPCSTCRGKGCEICKMTGQQYPETVEGIISKPLIALSEASDEAFHGAGREDIDALMLGEGRPFVLELKKPKKRSIDLDIATEKINKSDSVKVSSLRFCSKNIIKILKTSSSSDIKVYRALCSIENVSIVELEKIKSMNFPILLNQRTPTRVVHRRSDLIRHKKILKVEILSSSQNTVELKITAQGGTYIKEFISGDGGRTEPSISSILKKSALCIELDVLSVSDHNLFNS